MAFLNKKSKIHGSFLKGLRSWLSTGSNNKLANCLSVSRVMRQTKRAPQPLHRRGERRGKSLLSDESIFSLSSILDDSTGVANDLLLRSPPAWVPYGNAFRCDSQAGDRQALHYFDEAYFGRLFCEASSPMLLEARLKQPSKCGSTVWSR